VPEHLDRRFGAAVEYPEEFLIADPVLEKEFASAVGREIESAGGIKSCQNLDTLLALRPEFRKIHFK
jgi:hypothetical protein